MSEQPADIPEAPPAPPEVEQAAMLGNVRDAVSLYMRHTGADEQTARAVVERIAAEFG